jgi:hypothetical protein
MLRILISGNTLTGFSVQCPYPLNHRGNKLEEVLAFFCCRLIGSHPHLPPSYQSPLPCLSISPSSLCVEGKACLYKLWRGWSWYPIRLQQKSLCLFQIYPFLKSPHPPRFPKGVGTKFCVMWSRRLLECSQIYIKAEKGFILCATVQAVPVVLVQPTDT